MKFIFVFLLIILAYQTFASSEDTKTKTVKDLLVQDTVEKPLINELVEIKPVQDHHFNLEAPQDCGNDSSIDASARMVSCQFHSAGTRKVTVSVCDNDKNYCKQEKLTVNVKPQNSGNLRISQTPLKETLKMQTETKNLLMADFKNLNPSEARQAITTKKAALVLVSTDWCPPCNMAKEFLLPTDKFKNTTKSLLKIYVDGDRPESVNWEPLLKTKFYPTFVILNKDLKPVALFSDINLEKNTQAIEKALLKLEDPIYKLKTRIENRRNGNFWQSIKDYFYTESSIEDDKKRYIDHLGALGQFKEQITYIESLENKSDFKYDLLKAYFMADMMGQEPYDLEGFKEEDLKAKKISDLEKLIVESQKLKEDYFIPLTTYCEITKNSETKEMSENCLQHISDFQKEKEWNKGLAKTKAEKTIENANNLYLNARIFEILDEEAKADELYAECFKTYDKLYQMTPLEKKSRSVRIEQLKCMNNNKVASMEKEKFLKALAKDFPFEETFHRKLSKYYQSKKEYKKALSENEKALKYSYGRMWLYNVYQKSELLKALEKNKEAFEVLGKALDEVAIEKETSVGSNTVLKMVRKQYETLKKEVL